MPLPPRSSAPQRHPTVAPLTFPAFHHYRASFESVQAELRDVRVKQLPEVVMVFISSLTKWACLPVAFLTDGAPARWTIYFSLLMTNPSS